MAPSKIEIKIADNGNLFDLKLCAKDYLDFIENFQNKFQNKKFFILTAYSDSVLAGILVAEDKSNKIDSLSKIIPNMYLHLLFVNPNFRNKHLGKKLLNSLILIQKKKGIASIFIKLPQKYKMGINFFQKNDFRQVGKVQDKIILELNLWNDYGVRDCMIIGDDFDNNFS